MNPLLILTTVIAYFLLLMIISIITGRKSDNETFFLGNKKSPWFIVAFGMIGASLSGVTFISIPGVVGSSGLNQQYSYMQIVFGYLLGYIVVANVLLPLYYRLNLTSIYTYLEKRFGVFSHKTGAVFFLISRTIGASFRLFLVAVVLQKFLMDSYHIPFEITVAITIILIWIYTFRGGIKTIVWTDTIQTIFMLAAVIITILVIKSQLHLSFSGLFNTISDSNYSQWFFFSNWKEDPNFFLKQFFSGAFITIVMTGLDQDMMQKNLSCKTYSESKKNMYTLSISLFFTNIIFLSLGALLFIYMDKMNINIPTRMVNGEIKLAYDLVFPTIALLKLPVYAGIIFIIGIIAAAYSSADSALTSLTTSFSIDILNIEKKKRPEKKFTTKRYIIHAGFSLLLFFIVIIFWYLNDDSVINSLFKAAGYTYGPILGLFAFGLMTKFSIREKFIPLIAIASIGLTFLLNNYSEYLFNNYKMGFELLLVNGFFTFLGMCFLIKPKMKN